MIEGSDAISTHVELNTMIPTTKLLLQLFFLKQKATILRQEIEKQGTIQQTKRIDALIARIDKHILEER